MKGNNTRWNGEASRKKKIVERVRIWVNTVDILHFSFDICGKNYDNVQCGSQNI